MRIPQYQIVQRASAFEFFAKSSHVHAETAVWQLDHNLVGRFIDGKHCGNSDHSLEANDADLNALTFNVLSDQ
jgi:hypothetical protein